MSLRLGGQEIRGATRCQVGTTGAVEQDPLLSDWLARRAMLLVMTVALSAFALCGVVALLAKIPSAPRPEDVNPGVYRMLVGGYFHL